MGTTTMGVKLDDATRERIKTAASRIDRTPHWLIKQAIFNYLERLENDDALPELPVPRMRVRSQPRRRMKRISLSWNLPNRSCRSQFPAQQSPPRTAAPKPMQCRC